MAQFSTSLDSSMLTRCAYDDETRQLELTFKGGRTYTYSDVPKEEYDGLVGAASPGRYWHENIKEIYR